MLLELVSQLGESVSPATMIGQVSRVLYGFLDTPFGEQRITDIARRSGLPKATVSRIVAELVDQHLLEHSGAGIRVGHLILRTGRECDPPAGVAAVVIDSHERSSQFDQTNDSLGHSGRNRGGVHSDSVRKNRPSLGVSCRGRLPAHATAVGKVMLAFASHTRRRWTSCDRAAAPWAAAHRRPCWTSGRTAGHSEHRHRSRTGRVRARNRVRGNTHSDQW